MFRNPIDANFRTRSRSVKFLVIARNDVASLFKGCARINHATQTPPRLLNPSSHSEQFKSFIKIFMNLCAESWSKDHG